MPTLLTLLYFGYLSRNSIRFLASVSLKLFASQQSDNSAEADLRKIKKKQESPFKQGRWFFARQECHNKAKDNEYQRPACSSQENQLELRVDGGMFLLLCQGSFDLQGECLPAFL